MRDVKGATSLQPRKGVRKAEVRKLPHLVHQRGTIDGHVQMVTHRYYGPL